MADTSLIFNIIAKDQTKGGFDKIKTGAAAAGLAIGAVLMSGIGTAIEKGKLDAKLAAQLGATPAQAKEIGKLSGKVYADGFGEDMAGVSMAIKSAATNGLVDMKNVSAKASQDTIKNLLTVGTVLEEDTDRVSSAVSQMLRTGLAKSSEEAMDILVTATQKGVNKSQDLLDTVNEYGTQFRKLGLSGKQSMGLLSQAIQAGARDSDTAADALKEFSIRAIDGSKLTAQSYKQLGLDGQLMGKNVARGGDFANEALDITLEKLRGIKDPVKQAQIATGLFGTKAEDLGKALFAMNPSLAAKQMGDLAGSTSAAAKTASSGVAGWSTLGRQFQMALVDTLNKALPAVNAVFGFMQRNSSWIKPIAIGITALAVAIAVASAATAAWNVVLALSPITWIVIGIGALIAVIVLVATKTRFFQTVWGGVWGFLKAIGGWFAGPFVQFFVGGWHGILSAFGWARNAVMAVVGFIKAYYVGLWNGFSSMVTKTINAGVRLVGWITSMPGKVRGALSGMFNGLWSGFRANVNRLIGGWNRLQFSIGGGSFAGISFPSVSFGTPNIPYMASGGMIRSDGLLFGHAGETITKKAQVTRTGPGAGSGGGGSGGATITINGSNAKVIRVLLELLREGIRDQGGDPVKVLTAR